ncbi:MAG: hypothetical protein JW727_02905 [Candidatus Aenigmarchaeota archaeon]|nr:hypothetical protein [Candidatus Aenigmarchaeota archaeon]
MVDQTVFIVGGVVFVVILVYLISIRDRLYFKKTDADSYWRGAGREPYNRSLPNATICGIIISLCTMLFLNYFHDWNGLGGMVVIDAVLVLLVAYPARNPLLAVGVLAAFVLPVGYFGYGTYAEYIITPLTEATGVENFDELKTMTSHTLHCTLLIMTDQQAYDEECVMNDQQKEVEQQPEDLGLEVTGKRIFPEKEIAAGDPIEISLEFENQGGYEAKNVEISVDTTEDVKFRVCEEEVFKEVLSKPSQKHELVRPTENGQYRLIGKVSDPWMIDNCTYAKNKPFITAKMRTLFSYDYETEAKLPLEIIKSLNETHQYNVVTAKEAAAPMAILMHTTTPLSAEDTDYNYRIIQVRLQKDYDGGTITFRGKYDTMDSIYRVGDGALDTLYKAYEDYPENPISSEWKWIKGSEYYDFCVDKADPTKRISAKDALDCASEHYQSCQDGEDPAKTIAATDAEDCHNKRGTPVIITGEPIYKARAQMERSGTVMDEVTITCAGGDNCQYLALSCNGQASEEEGTGGCICQDGVCTIKYVGGKGDLRLEKKGDPEILYGRLKVEVTGFPDDGLSNTITVDLRAKATYNVLYDDATTMTIISPHQ